MIKNKKILTKLSVCIAIYSALCGIVEAALPPLYQSSNEFKALLDSPQLIEHLASGEALQSITRDDTGFVIKTNQQSIRIVVVYDSTGMPGPAKFHLLFQSAENLPSKQN